MSKGSLRDSQTYLWNLTNQASINSITLGVLISHALTEQPIKLWALKGFSSQMFQVFSQSWPPNTVASIRAAFCDQFLFPVCFSAALINHSDQKQVGKERVFFNLRAAVHLQRSPKHRLKAGTEAEAMEVSLPSPGCLTYLSYIAQRHLPEDGTTHSGLDSPTSISN